jgi:hypothetical protein
MRIREINRADTDGGPDSHKAGAGDQPAFGNRTKIVDLELDRGETARTGEMLMDRATYRGVGDARRDASVQGAGGIQQFRAQPALYGEAVAMHANDLQAEQVIECVFGEEGSDHFDWL